MSTRPSLRPDLHRAHVRLDALPPGTRVSDRDGEVWRLDRHGIYWELTGEPHDDILSSYQLAHLAPLSEVRNG